MDAVTRLPAGRSAQPRRKAQLLLLATALVWGATFTLVKAALADASPLVFNLLRMLVASAALLAVHWRQLPELRRHWKAGALTGLFLAAGYQFQTAGLARTTAAKSAFITGLVVIFVPAFTLIPAFRPSGTRSPGLAAAAGAGLAFAGLLLLTTPAGTPLARLFGTIDSGDLLTLACAVAFAAHLLTLAHFARRVSAGLLATLQIVACTLWMSLSLPLEPVRLAFTPRLLLSLLLCGVLATAAAFTIQSYAQQHLPPTQTVLILTLEPVFAAATSMLVLHETLGRRSLAGAALILGGILLIEWLPNLHATEIPA